MGITDHERFKAANDSWKRVLGMSSTVDTQIQAAALWATLYADTLIRLAAKAVGEKK